jgi:monovalent cation/hydrogen antiporter
VSVTISLLTGYAAFVPADAIGASGVLAAVTAGIVMGIRAAQILPARTRLQSGFVWDILDFIINAILFVLIGLQLRAVVQGLSGYTTSTLIGYGLAVTGVVVGVRIAWFFTVPYLIRAIDRRPSQRTRRVGSAARLVVAWSGMRGAVSLAVALALPLSTHAGDRFPKRDLIIFLTFAVIFFTLVVQGLSLPALMRRLGVSDNGADADEEIRARLVVAKAIERLRRFYEYRKERFAARAGKIDDDGYEDQTLAYQRTLQHLLGAQREALLRMRSDGDLSKEVMNRILREL